MPPSKQFLETLRTWTEKFMTRSMREWVQFVKTSGLSISQFQLLTKLYYQGSCGISEVSTQWDITMAAASQMVDKLVQQGLLERAEDPNDRRAKQVKLSLKGRTLVEKGVAARTRWMDDLSSVLNRDQQSSVVMGLQHLIEGAQKLELPAGKNS